MRAESTDSSPHVTLVSSFTIDRFPPDASGRRKEVTGGPAHYVGAALDRLGLRHRLITGDTAEVEVIPGPHGEHYLIQPLKTIPLPDRLSTPAVILSPIVAEIDPSTVPPVDGLLILDLQGFVRQPLRPTDELVEVDISELLARADVVKAASAEMERLSAESRAMLRDTMVVQTRGAHGALVNDRGKRYEISCHPVAAPHTVGAGDTFLAAFVAGLLADGHPAVAGERAARFTEKILRERGSAP